ncbi:antitoxin MazE family protein [Skermanella stibiiresistens]|uniref:antitoxin MazE family protein n=1 Tax=Skermanella stibiiresistens TaxID=913326 RepID=UPI000A03A892
MATPDNIRRNVQNYRTRLREKGLRPRTVWVPDTRSPEFAERVRRDSLAVSHNPSELDALEWIEGAMDEGDDA